MFKAGYADILEQLAYIDPKRYAASRNYIDGDVTYLSPYISRGVISTKIVYEYLKKEGYNLRKIEKFIQELAWRDYWQHIWVEKLEDINSDLKHAQPQVENNEIPESIIEGNTGINAVDIAIKELYSTGYMHNHLRMYLASIACNQAKSHWYNPSKWMYYHLLDGDWASNALSWQWVAGSNSNKQYVANQKNINQYTKTEQFNSFLDVEYDELPLKEIPLQLKATTIFDWQTNLPSKKPVHINPALPVIIYNSYNLDPIWRADESANRILLLEPSHFLKYPVSKKVLSFIDELSKNIPNIQIFVGEFDELKAKTSSIIFFKEHPTARHYVGIQDERDWMFSVKGYYSSFFSFWKKCKKEIPFE
ncbi:MAG: FAD-binding domain-containing protein [Crocinitomicaceae bacterium]